MTSSTEHLLSEARAIAHVLDRGFVSPQAALMNGLQVEAISRRNCNFSVTDRYGAGWFLKQGQAGELIGTVAYEAVAYRAFSRDLATCEFAQSLPEFIDFDATRNILTIRFIDSATTFNRAAMNNRLSPDAIADFARALASLHCLRSPGKAALARHPPPMVLSLDAPPVAFYHDASATSIELVKTLQQRVQLMRRLRKLREAWHSGRLIHYDVKLSNIMASGEPTRFAGIVDLEYLGHGDPRWDIGSVFAAFLDLWLASMPLAGGTTADRYEALATFPLESAQATITGFWRAYAAACTANGGSDIANLLDCARFTAARLIHTALELAMTSAVMTNRIAALVQLGDNVLCDPSRAVAKLFGFCATEKAHEHLC